MEKKDVMKLPGAKFVLCDECGKEIACGITDKNGELLFENLPFGKYFLKEIEAPCGFEKCEEIGEIVICGNHQHRCVEVLNVRRRGSIKVLKLGIDK